MAEAKSGPMRAVAAGRRRRLRLAAAALLLTVVGAGFIVGRQLTVRQVEVPLGLPTPIRLAVLSDFHLGARESGAQAARQAVREAMARHPDAILLGGDFVAGRAGLQRIPEVFMGIRAPLGVYAVLGNHDHWTGAAAVERSLASANVRLLTNDSVTLAKGRTRLALVGIDDLWAGKVDWPTAWRDVPRGVPVVLLSHNPDAALSPAGRRARLIVSGHTHAGTIWMPPPLYRIARRLIGVEPISHSRYGARHPYGLMRERWGWIYTTSGVTPGYAPPRWYTRPEVAVVELQ